MQKVRKLSKCSKYCFLPSRRRHRNIRKAKRRERESSAAAAANKIVCPTMCPPDVWGRSCDEEIGVQSPS